MKLNTPIIRRLLSRLVEKFVKNKLGKETKVDLQKVYARVDGDGAKLNVSLEVNMSKDEFEKLVREFL